MLPEVTGPYCSQTRSGAAPPEAWVSTWLYWLAVMEEELLEPVHGDVLVRGLVLIGQ